MMGITWHRKPSQMTLEELRARCQEKIAAIADIEALIEGLTLKRGKVAQEAQRFQNEIYRRTKPEQNTTNLHTAERDNA